MTGHIIKSAGLTRVGASKFRAERLLELVWDPRSVRCARSLLLVISTLTQASSYSHSARTLEDVRVRMRLVASEAGLLRL